MCFCLAIGADETELKLDKGTMKKLFMAMCLAASAILSGCGTVDPLRIRSQVGDKGLVVVVRVPNELSLSWVGTTLLNNESAVHANQDWDIKHWIEERSVALLRQAGRKARALVLQPGAQVALAQMIDSTNEVVLVIAPGYGPDKVFNRPPYVSGIGLRQHTWFGMEAASATYVQLDARILNPSHPQEVQIVSSESFQRLPFAALEKGPTLPPRVEGAVRDAIRVQIDGVVLDLIGRLGLFEGPIDSTSPRLPSVETGPRG